MTEIERDFDALWDYHNPAASEQRFRALLDRSISSAGECYLAELRTQIARTCSLQRKFDEAHAILDAVECSMAAGERGSGDDAEAARVRVRLMLERGRTLHSSGESARAMPAFEQAWALARAAGEDALAIDAAHMLAIVAGAGHARDISSSIRWNEIALELAESSSSNRARRWRASLQNNIGWSRHDAGDFEAALRSFQRGLDLRLEQGDAREVRIAQWCVARCLRSLGRVGEALRVQSSLLAEDASPDDAHAGFVHEEIGECLLELGEAAGARPHFAEAHRILRNLAHIDSNRLNRLARLAGVEPAQP